jgi:hypothetical protein
VAAGFGCRATMLRWGYQHWALGDILKNICRTQS